MAIVYEAIFTPDNMADIALGNRPWGVISEDKIPGGYHPFPDGTRVCISQIEVILMDEAEIVVKTKSGSLYLIKDKES